MALTVADRVKETTTTTGTGTYSLEGASTGYQSFVSGIGDTNTVYYCATDGTDWEVGLGTVTDAATDTLSRDSIIDSSNAGSAVNWGAGTRDIFATYPGSSKEMRTILEIENLRVDTITPSSDTDYTLTTAEYGLERLNLVDGSWSQGRTILIPAAAGNRRYFVDNSAGTYDAAIGISGGASVTVPAGTSRVVLADGTDAKDPLPIIDEDDMVSDSAYLVPTQQSVKKYVDDSVSVSAGNWVELGRHLITSGVASAEFTSLITSTYDEYLITLAGVRPATNGAQFLMTLSNNNGSSYFGGTGYIYSRTQLAVSGETYAAGNGVSSFALTTGVYSAVAADGVDGHISFIRPLTSSLFKMKSEVATPSSTPEVYLNQVVGMYNATAVINAVKFAFSSGNIDEGDIRIFGRIRGEA